MPELQGDLGTLFAHELKTDATSADERKIFAMTKEDPEPDDNPIIENTQISHPLHANTDVLDGEVQEHTVDQVVDVPVSPETVEERISECTSDSPSLCQCARFGMRPRRSPVKLQHCTWISVLRQRSH